MISLRIALALSGVAATVLIGAGLYLSGRHHGVATERPRTEAALAQADVSRLETDGARASAARIEIVVQRRDAANAVTADLTPKALQAEDANAPLEADRAGRLSRADRELCRLAPDLVGCAQD